MYIGFITTRNLAPAGCNINTFYQCKNIKGSIREVHEGNCLLYTHLSIFERINCTGKCGFKTVPNISKLPKIYKWINKRINRTYTI